MFRITSILILLILAVATFTRTIEDSEDIGHGLRMDNSEEIGHGLTLDKRSADSSETETMADEEELVGHGIKSNHAWRK